MKLLLCLCGCSLIVRFPPPLFLVQLIFFIYFVLTKYKCHALYCLNDKQETLSLCRQAMRKPLSHLEFDRVWSKQLFYTCTNTEYFIFPANPWEFYSISTFLEGDNFPCTLSKFSHCERPFQMTCLANLVEKTGLTVSSFQHSHTLQILSEFVLDKKH